MHLTNATSSRTVWSFGSRKISASDAISPSRQVGHDILTATGMLRNADVRLRRNSPSTRNICFRQSRQNVWWHGNIFGIFSSSSNVSRQIKHFRKVSSNLSSSKTRFFLLFLSGVGITTPVSIGWLNPEMATTEISMYVHKKILLDLLIICFTYITNSWRQIAEIKYSFKGFYLDWTVKVTDKLPEWILWRGYPVAGQETGMYLSTIRQWSCFIISHY